MNADELKKEIKKMNALMSSFSDYGATDSEPDWYFTKLMRRAIKGEPMPVIKDSNWELYESREGWQNAAKALTEEASSLYVLIQSSSLIEVKKIESMFY